MEIVLTDDNRILIWPLAALILLMGISWRRKRGFSYFLCAAVFGVYLLVAVNIAFFPIQIGGSYAEQMRQVAFAPFINLAPFNFNLSEMPELVWKQIFQNILLTVPFGFGINFLVSIRARRIFWLALAVGVGIEAIQLLISLLLRYPYRVIDINDAILNTSGVFIGYGLFRLFAWLYLWATRRLRIEHGGLTAYVYDVARRA